jgi:hypothetical protein
MLSRPRLLIAVLATAPLFSQPVGHTPRGNAASPEALAWHRYAAQAKAVIEDLDRSVAPTPPLPAPPAGVTDLSFADFFGPIGDRGLDYGEKIRALAGRRVRLTGFMVREQERAPGIYRLAPWPVVVETQGLCNADDTPAAVAYIVTADAGPRSSPAPWRPGRLVLTGTLEIGSRAEADGRNSFIRLVLAPASPVSPQAQPASASSAPAPTEP